MCRNFFYFLCFLPVTMLWGMDKDNFLCKCPCGKELSDNTLSTLQSHWDTDHKEFLEVAECTFYICKDTCCHCSHTFEETINHLVSDHTIRIEEECFFISEGSDQTHDAPTHKKQKTLPDPKMSITNLIH